MRAPAIVGLLRPLAAPRSRCCRRRLIRTSDHYRSPPPGRCRRRSRQQQSSCDCQSRPGCVRSRSLRNRLRCRALRRKRRRSGARHLCSTRSRTRVLLYRPPADVRSTIRRNRPMYTAGPSKPPRPGNSLWHPMRRPASPGLRRCRSVGVRSSWRLHRRRCRAFRCWQPRSGANHRRSRRPTSSSRCYRRPADARSRCCRSLQRCRVARIRMPRSGGSHLDLKQP